MNAVSLGQWVRYQLGGGQTVNSQATTSAGGRRNRSSSRRRRRRPFAGLLARRLGARGDGEGSRLLHRHGLTLRGNGNGHIACVPALGRNHHAVSADEMGGVTLSRGSHLHFLIVLNPFAGTSVAALALHPNRLATARGRALGRAVGGDGLFGCVKGII